MSKAKKTKIHITFQVDENGDYIVSDNLSLMYGIGATLLLALHDYSTSLIEYIEIRDKHKSSKEIGASREPTELELGNVGGESPQQPERGRIAEMLRGDRLDSCGPCYTVKCRD